MPEQLSKTRQEPIRYRADIDGLRAIAVLAVIFYHARLGVPGGFVGVDVFFVLSGFLITSIILTDLASAGGFSILKFWERRIRRILPALLVVIVSTVCVGWFVLLPSDFWDLGKSVMAQAVFGGNFYFWLSGGYFAQPAILKPLLHTWSLSVEEQYYLFFPVLFLVGRKWKIGTWRWAVGLAALFSLVLSVAMTRSSPNAAFFLLPSRAWELFVGALLAMAPGKLKVPRLLGETIGWGGLSAIAVAVSCFDRSTAFPGLAAVLPCAGTAAIIWANDLGRPSSTVARLLSIGPLVFLGKISYSLYLWHWPVLVYALYWADNSIVHWPIRVGLLGLSVMLAAASWKWVETPFRTRQALPERRAIFAFGLISPITCVLLGAVLFLSHGMPSRFSEAVVRCDAARLHDSVPSLSRADLLSRAQQGKFPGNDLGDGHVHCLVWGDSHAMAVSPALAKVAAEYSSDVEFAMYPATAPILDYESFEADSLRQDSVSWCEAVVEHVRRQHISNVLLVANWLWYCGLPNSKLTNETPAMKEIAGKVAATTVALQEAGAKVWIMKTVPFQPVWVPIGMAKALLKGRSIDIGVPKQKYVIYSSLQDELFAPAAARGAIILDPAPYFFVNRETCLVEASGYPLYFDDNHINNRGAMLLMGLFRPIWANDFIGSGK